MRPDKTRITASPRPPHYRLPRLTFRHFLRLEPHYGIERKGAGLIDFVCGILAVEVGNNRSNLSTEAGEREKMVNKGGAAMSHREEILEQALTLPLADRAFVAAALGDSLLPEALAAAAPDALTGGELLAELQRRSASYRDGTTPARPAAEVMADLRRSPAGGPTK